MRHEAFSSSLKKRIHVFYPNQGTKNYTFLPSKSKFIADSNANLEVYNMSGVQVYHKLLTPSISKQDKYEINIPYQPSGLYLYGITSDNGDLIEEGKLIYF
jgi:hypothetical protein